MDGSLQDKSPTALRAAEHADLLMQPVSDEARAAVQSLFDELVAWEFAEGHRRRNFKADAADRMRATIAAMLGDLLLAALNNDALGYCYRESDRGSFKHTMAESRHYDAIRRAWHAQGYLQLVNGFRGSDTWDDGNVYYPGNPSSKWASRLRATSKLLVHLDKYDIRPDGIGRHFRRNLARSQPVVLKATKRGPKKGARMAFVSTKRVRQLEEEVTEINSFLADQDFDFGPAPYLYRSFNNGDDPEFNWDLGGRFYAAGTNYLNWEATKRRQITINGDAVTELDITACQLTLLHALLGEPLDLNSDPFEIDGLTRSKAKMTFNVIVGLGRASILETDTVSDRRRRERRLLIDTYPILQNIESEGWNSLKLQCVDADIMSKALLTLFRCHRIPALPVHDCLIVKRQDANLAEEVFADAFFDRVGVVPKITRS